MIYISLIEIKLSKMYKYFFIPYITNLIILNVFNIYDNRKKPMFNAITHLAQ